MSRSELDRGPVAPSPERVTGGARHRYGTMGLIRLAAALLALSAAVHIAMVWPAQGHLIPAFDDHAYLVVQQIVLAVGWLVAAGLVAAGTVARGRPGWVIAGAVLAAGMALAELGIVVSNLGEVLSESTAGIGAWLFVAAWLIGSVGVVAALVGAGPGARAVVGRPGRLAGGDQLVAAAGGAAAIVVGVALLPAWDHYVITSSVLRRTIATQSLGSAFAAGTPGGVLTGDLMVAVAFAAVPLIAMWWRPSRVGTLLSGGVLVVIVSQLASGLVGFRSSPSSFGFSAAQVRTYGVRVHSSLTASFVVELVAGAVLLLLLLARWRRTADGRSPRSGAATAGPPGWAGGRHGQPPFLVDGAHNGGWGPPVVRPPDP